MFQVFTELLLIGCSIDLIRTPKSELNTSTPETNFQWSFIGHSPQEIGHLIVLATTPFSKCTFQSKGFGEKVNTLHSRLSNNSN